MGKNCSKCGDTKPLDQFSKAERYKNGTRPVCKRCHNSHAVKAKYGLTIDDYQTMWDNQNGVCAICERPETVTRNERVCLLAVDHCHTTGKVRGLLCARCNSMLGQAQDSTGTLLNAIIYLQKEAQ